MQHQTTNVIGHFVVIGIPERNARPADVITIFARSVVTVYDGEDELWKGLLMFFHEPGEQGAVEGKCHASRFIDISSGLPDRVELVFPEGAELGMELTLESQIIEISEA